MDQERPRDPDAFVEEAARPRRGLARELADFVREHKKWWLAPILIALAMLGALAFLGGTGAAPFIYTLF